MEITLRKANAHKKGKRSGKRGPRYWIVAVGTMGAIVAFTIGNSRAVRVGYAAERNGRIQITQQTNDDFRKIKFEIPAGRLEDVLDAFKKAAGVTIKVERPQILDIKSPGVSGEFTIEQALRKLLIDTGVSYTFEGVNAISLVLHVETAVVNVDTRDAKIVSSPKYTEPLSEIPQTITVIPKEVIQEQAATTLRDVLNNVPGITATAGEGGTPAGDNLTIRGFSARNDIYVDGVRDLGPQSRDPFNLEQVEVVKGPSSTFTGRGSTGGTINLVSKQPDLKKSFGGDLTLGSSGLIRGTADIDLPLTDSIAFRLNLVAHDSNFPGREEVQNRRWGASPSITFGLGTATRYSFSYYYLQQSNISDYGIPWVPVTNNVLVAYRNRPAPVPRDTFYGLVDRDHEHLRSDLGTFRYEHDFNDNMSIRNQFRYGKSTRDSFATPPRFASDNSIVMTREVKSWVTDDDIWDNQTDLTAKFFTGGVQNDIDGGTALSYEKNRRVTRTGPNMPTTLFDPNPNDVYTGVIVTNPLVPVVSAKTYAAYVFDTIKFTRAFSFVGGLRWDYFDAGGTALTTTVTPNRLDPIGRIDRIFSGRAAFVYHPAPHGTFYASYGSSADPSLEGLSYSTANTAIGPEKTRNYELGTKWEMLDQRVLFTGAAFRVDKTNARTPGIDPGDPPQVLDGQQRVDGIELSATGLILRNWQVIAGYTLLKSKVLSSNTAPTIVNGVAFYELGKELINTPRNSFNLWSTYTYKKLFFGGGPRFVDRRFGNNINTRFVDSYWIVDAMGSYRLTKHVELRLNLNNLTDKYYIDRIGGGHIIPGAARSVSMSTGFTF